MIHRRPSHTDGEGPPVSNDFSILKDVELRIVIGTPQYANRLRHVVSLLQQFPPQIIVGDTQNKFAGRVDWLNNFKSNWSLVDGSSFPPNLHLLSLDATAPKRNPVNGTTIVRFVNLYENGEDPQYSSPVRVDLGVWFPSFQFANLTGMYLIDLQQYWYSLKNRNLADGSIHC